MKRRSCRGPGRFDDDAEEGDEETDGHLLGPGRGDGVPSPARSGLSGASWERGDGGFASTAAEGGRGRGGRKKPLRGALKDLMGSGKVIVTSYRLPVKVHWCEAGGGWVGRWDHTSVLARSSQESIADDLRVVWAGLLLPECFEASPGGDAPCCGGTCSETGSVGYVSEYVRLFSVPWPPLWPPSPPHPHIFNLIPSAFPHPSLWCPAGVRPLAVIHLSVEPIW